ncbi:hypothetical protein roselon_00828 [Roseibacterium elongatum DSM 19469]|uniref:Uncharacterized protein n=1 Tax=Roseicyclus elongatus DSM 19469 TaxID=1294273 RepID=W8SL22_9RHOB|nr:hypothetical protein [Roseibacterium elongatum]AHM03240.1 hypothetical protein roselon_00828 [Roseibacterium elongatum DSM 19469]
MAVIDNFVRITERAPRFGLGQWMLRIPLAAILVNQGLLKVYGGMASNAEAFGIPVWAFALATLADFAAPAALILGGLYRHWTADLLTRVGGFTVAASTIAVIAVVYGGGSWLGWQFQALITAGGLFFLIRGNETQPRGA